MFVNKLVLSSPAQGFYGFPSFKFLSLAQFVVTSVILLALNRANKVQITDLSPDVAQRMAPLATISLLNVLSGLGGTKRLNLPMFTVRASAHTIVLFWVSTHCASHAHSSPSS